jgi:serine/threonine protein kinase
MAMTSKKRGSRHESTEPWIDSEFLSLRLDTKALEDIKPLGFSNLWLVRHQGGRLLVSTRLIARHVTAECIHGFVDDIKLMARLQHANIVALVGVAWTNERDLQALIEFIDGGDLHEFLRESPRRD